MTADTSDGDAGKEWARPLASGTPNRPGDLDEMPLYTALGRAVSNWEGVNAATSSLFAAIRQAVPSPDEDSELDSFSTVRKIHGRIQRLEAAAEGFLGADFGEDADKARRFGDELVEALLAYRGWAGRRNDLAHGYVTDAEGPDYASGELSFVTTYSLCPSHARSKDLWVYGEPVFNYLAAEIEAFAAAFRRLDEQFERLTAAATELHEGRQPPVA